MPRRTKTPLTLKPSVLKDLLAAEAVDTVLVQGVEDGFHVLIGFGDEEKPLGLARGDQERVFKTLQSAVNSLDKLGIAHASLDWTRHSPPPKPPRRPTGPGRAAARERTEQAIVYETRVRKSLETAMAQIDDGTAKLTEWTPEWTDGVLEEALARYETRQRARKKTEK